MRCAGQDGADNKLIVGRGEFEFLRRMFCHDGVIRGYLNRSIPNVISTDLQGQEADSNDPVMAIQSIISQAQKLRVRGFNKTAAQELETLMIRRWSKPGVKGNQLYGLD